MGTFWSQVDLTWQPNREVCVEFVQKSPGFLQLWGFQLSKNFDVSNHLQV